MKSSLEFINVCCKAFSKETITEKVNNVPLAFQGSFELWKTIYDGIENYVICFDKLDSLTFLLQFYTFLKKENNNTYIFLSKDFCSSEKNYLKIIYKYRIPFVDYTGVRLINNDKINYLDQLFSDLKLEKDLTYTKNTQLVFKYYLFNKINSYTVRDVAKYLNISPSSVSRANETLFNLGALTKSGFGAGLEYKLINKKKALWLLKQYFILPYEKIYFLMLEDKDYEIISSNNPLSGEAALGEYTDLLPISNNEIYAIWKNEFAPFYNAYLDLVYEKQTHLIGVHSYIYNPKLFTDNQYIDLFDLYVIVLKTEDINDPRIKDALKQIERKLTNE